MNAESFQNLILYRYRYVVAYILMFFISLVAVLYQIVELLPGVSSGEVEQGLKVTQDSTTILEQGLYLPYNLLQSISINILGESALALRIPSAIFAILTLAALYLLIHAWHKEKIAIITIIFFATSSWFLTFARIGTPYIFTAFSLVVILLVASLIRHSEKPNKWIVSAAFFIPMTLYSPLMIYILALFVFLYREQIRNLINESSKSNLAVLALIGFASIVPLLYAFFSSFDNFTAWLGVSDGIPSIRDYFSNVLTSVEHILWRSNSNSSLHLGDLSMLDIFTSTMAALGLWHYEQHFKWLRTRFLIYGLGILIFSFGLSNDEGRYFVIAPIIYIMAATGIVTLLNQWNRIFPVNPFARTIALLPLALALLVTSQYHLDKYFSAWASAPNTRKAFAIEPTLLEKDIESSPAERILIVTDENEHRSLLFLLNDATSGREIDIVNPKEGELLTNISRRYQYVYLDGNVEGDLKNRLDRFISETIESNRQSKPIAYRVYNMSTRVSDAHRY